MGTIRFPHLGFEVLAGNSFTVFGFEIAYYGVIIALGMICGAIYAYYEAKRTRQKVDNYIDYTIYGIIGAVIGARIYYVAFEWDQYKDNLIQIINIRAGGLAIYGAIIGAIIVLLVYCKIKKLIPLKFLDTMVFGLVIGQIIGRWGNFFNREAYGGYTDNIFAMQIPLRVVDPATVTESMLVTVNGTQYIQVHPTFLYESFLNLILLIILIVLRDKRKFYGETFCRYLMGYGLIRFFVEGLRTDQLQVKGIAVSQVLSIVIFVLALAFIVIKRIMLRGEESEVEPLPVKVKKDRRSRKKEEIFEEDDDTEEFEAEEYANEEDSDEEVELEKDSKTEDIEEQED